MSIDLKDTLNLPKTDFPMKADLVQREPQRQAHWEGIGLYERIMKKHATSPSYILNDGPPYTNGDIHLGTAFNKILKDLLLRYKSTRGFKAPFVPVWDCHGLPIEHKVSRELEDEKRTLDAAGIREACAQFSAKYRERMTGQFKRLGVLGEWEKPFQTMDATFEADILRVFAQFVEKDHVYRSKKPVYWSIPCKTALAEGEVEYQDITSPSIYVGFKLTNPEKLGVQGPVCAVIWTTTPWTLPSNLAIAAHPELSYVLLRHAGQGYLVAEGLAETVIAACDLVGAIREKTFSGKQLENLETRHPFIDRASPFVLADYVSADTGTGFVHTAPGHGLDDYATGLRYGLEIYSPINDEGCYINDGRVPATLVGISVFTNKGKNAANDAVFALLEPTGMLLKRSSITHSFPHCWRSKTPIVTRATDQWFIALDKHGLREKALQAISQVKWTPSNGENRIRAAIENRPDWCISRQRAWGNPLPVFYDDEGQAYVDANVVRALADKISAEGSNIWFRQTAEELLKGIELPGSWKGKQLKPGTDTIEVWIDSGSSHYAVLKHHKDLSWPADIYLEGVDQHRGWFNSSLWTGVVMDGQAPYRHVLTHGFVVNEDRQKISKSAQKTKTAMEYVDKMGADVLRLWVASEDYQNDVPLSDTILAQVTQVYRTIRNTLRFLLGNLYDFDIQKNAVAWDRLTPIDQWALSETSRLIEEVTAAYDAFAFHRAYQLLSRFITVTLSAIYHDILKDRLYVSAPNSPMRRSSQTAMHTILQALLPMLSPILVHTADEAYAYAQGNQDFVEDSIHLQDWPIANPAWFNLVVTKDMGIILALREKAHAALEPLRQAKTIGQSSDAQLILRCRKDDAHFELLKKYEAILPELFIVSAVTLIEWDDAQLQIEAKPAEGVRCPRSWKWVPKLVECPGYGMMSPKSRDALLEALK